MKFIVRFSPLLYPTVGGFGKDSGGQKLITDLCQAARSHGNCALISNGSSAKACKDQRVLLCSNGRKYHQRLDGAQADAYRVTTYIGDKKNCRGSNNSGKALRRRNCTQRDTRCTCSAKIVIRLDQYSFHLVCGVGDNQHRGHPPMTHNKITNRKRFLDAPTLENAAAMAAANILPSQAALFTQSSTGELFTRRQMAYVQGFSQMAQDLIDLSPQGAALPSDMSPSDSMLNYLKKIGASFVCLYHNGNTKQWKAPQPISLYLLRSQRLLISRNMPREVGTQSEQGTTRTFLLHVAGCCQMADVSFKYFQKLFASMGRMSQPMKADPCLHFLSRTRAEM
jgi:hypothetical protein